MREIPILNSVRFFLILYIVFGHFGQFLSRNVTYMQLIKQHNIVVGAFFALSGFLLALSSGHKSKDFPITITAFLSRRLVRIYPTYLFVLLVFSPMFISIAYHYKQTSFETLKQIVIVTFLAQAWMPDWGLLWNSPTWFLSSLLFSYALFPWIYRLLKPKGEKTLWISLLAVLITTILVRTVYSFYVGWDLVEGIFLPKKDHWSFNLFRFHPVINALEFYSGVVLGLLSSKTTPQTQKPPSVINITSFVSTLLVLCLIIRLWVPINDLLFRNLVFIPIFLFWLYQIQRQEPDWLTRTLSRPAFVYLGKISFCIYIIHGALGQLFFKRAVRSLLLLPSPDKVSPELFLIFISTLLLLSILCYHLVEKPAGSYLNRKIRKSSQQRPQINR